MMRLFQGVWLLGACLWGLAAWADGTCTGVQWPGWRVETSEYSDGAGYPITNMLDGSSATAWVFHKPRNSSTGHGVDTNVRITADAGTGTPLIDGIALINGYAKSATTYWRNNRVTKVHVSVWTKGANYAGTFTLAETRRWQRIPLRPGRWEWIDLRVVAVAAGPEDDLCLSELALTSGGKALSWGVTPTVLYNQSNDCGCGGGPDFKLMTRAGRILTRRTAPRNAFLGAVPLPGTTRMLLCTRRTGCLYDFASGTMLAVRHFPGDIQRLGWTDRHHALLHITDRTGRTRWYRFTLPPRWDAVPAPKARPEFINERHQPNYGC